MCPVFNLNTAEIPDRLVLQPQLSVGKLIQVDFVEENSKGNPMATWTFKMLNGPDKGESIKYYTVITPEQPKNMGNLKQLLAAYHLEGKFTDFDPEDGKLLGKQLGILVTNTKRLDPDTRETVTNYNIKKLYSMEEYAKAKEKRTIEDKVDETAGKVALMPDDEDAPKPAPAKATVKKKAAAPIEVEEDEVVAPVAKKPSVKKVAPSATVKMSPQELAAKKDWEGMEVADRTAQAKTFSFSGKTGAKAWAELTSDEQHAMYEFPETTKAAADTDEIDFPEPSEE
jgi:hypothetical protein